MHSSNDMHTPTRHAWRRCGPQIAPLSTSKGPGEGGEPHQFYYPDGDADVGVIAYGTPAGANGQIAKLVAGEAAKAIKAKGAFTLVLTGEKRVEG